MARDVLQPHETFLKRLRGYSALTELPEYRLVQICGGCSHQGALNILQGAAKQTPESLSAIINTSAFINCPPDEIVVGLTMPTVPPEKLAEIVDRVRAEVKGLGTRTWLLKLRQHYEQQVFFNEVRK